MKKSIITLLLAFIVSAVFAQTKKYYSANVRYTTSCGENTSWMDTDGSTDFEYLKSTLKKWIKPYKLLSFEITSVKQIAKPKYRTKSEKFKCPEPIKIKYDTASYGLLSNISVLGSNTFSQSSFIFTGNGNSPTLKIKMHQTNYETDSLTMLIKKSQIRWINDSTAIIRKP
jgi:hypothetical protein